jgi:putative Holliday junction resolvase
MASSLRDSSSRPASPAGRVLAIDYGRRQIGLAISDAQGVISKPLTTLTRTNRRKLLRQLREIVHQHEVWRILVGHPVNLDGTIGEMAKEAARFAARLKKELGLPIELVDERLTSWAAERMLAKAKRSARQRFGTAHHKRRGAVHRIAAAVILRDYLEREQAGKQAQG